MRDGLRRAHNRFRHAEPYVGLILASGFFSWLGKQLKVFGELGWPEAIFLGVATAAIVGLAFAAVLVGWRYFRPLVPHEAVGRGAEPLAQPDQAAELRAQVQNIENRLGIVEERLEKITQATLRVYDTIYLRDAADRIQPLLAELDEQLAAPPPVRTNVVGRIKVARNVREHVLAELGRILPPDREHYERRRDERVAAIQQNAIYCTVKPEEEENFPSGEEKQGWHIAKAEMEALHQWLSDLLTGPMRNRMLEKRDDQN